RSRILTGLRQSFRSSSNLFLGGNNGFPSQKNLGANTRMCRCTVVQLCGGGARHGFRSSATREFMGDRRSATSGAFESPSEKRSGRAAGPREARIRRER